jgi:hypothetical protein
VTVDATVGCTYPKLVHLSSEGASGRWYLFYRNFPSQYAAYTDDGGATWSTPFEVFEEGDERPYVHCVSNGIDRIDFFATTGHPDETATSMYHAYYDGTWRNTAGSSMGSLPITVSDASLVWDGTSVDSWVSDVKYQGGEPVATFHTYESLTNHRARYAYYDGSTWQVSLIAEVGDNIYGSDGVEDQYAAGLCLGVEDFEVYVCVEVSSQKWDLRRYVSSDGGDTWTFDATIKEGLVASRTYKNMRPYRVEGGGPVKLVWLHGVYGGWGGDQRMSVQALVDVNYPQV